MRLLTHRQSAMSFKTTPPLRTAITELAARRSLSEGRRVTLTDVIEEAVRLLAEREGVVIGDGQSSPR